MPLWKEAWLSSATCSAWITTGWQRGSCHKSQVDGRKKWRKFKAERDYRTRCTNHKQLQSYPRTKWNLRTITMVRGKKKCSYLENEGHVGRDTQTRSETVINAVRRVHNDKIKKIYGTCRKLFLHIQILYIHTIYRLKILYNTHRNECIVRKLNVTMNCDLDILTGVWLINFKVASKRLKKLCCYKYSIS